MRRAHSSLSSSRTTATSTVMLILLLMVVGMAILYNNQVLYYDKWSLKSDYANNHISRDDNNSTTSSSSSSSGRRRDATGNSNSAAATTTMLLTRTSQLSSLLSNLDASDVIECYIVTRMANLANVEAYSSSSSSGKGGGGKQRSIQTVEKEDDTTTASSSSSSSSIPTGPILIRKAALAFRYRPKVASASHGTTTTTTTTLANKEPSSSSLDTTTLDQQKYFELTLEYGPQRAGASKTSESMPMVHVDMELLASYYEGGNSNNDNNNNIGKYVSWDNQGSIYYSTHISNEWSGAYYMSSITGVVLEKILEKVVEYPTKRPRYQPFEVISIPSNNIILKSSGSDDFVWDMFRDLADLYVDIDPILVPPRGKVQFYVADPIIEADNSNNNNNDHEVNNIGGTTTTTNSEVVAMKPRRLPNPNVKRVKGALESSKAAAFYENFFNCANAKKTGDYSMYLPSLVSTTTLAPSPVPPIIIDDDEEDSNILLSNTTSGGGGGGGVGVPADNKLDDTSDGNGSLLRRILVDDASSNSTVTTNSQSNDKGGDVKRDENSPDSSHVTETAEVVAVVGIAPNTADEEGSVSAPQIDDDDDTKTTEPDEGSVDSEDDGDAAKAAEKAAIEAAQKAETAAAVAATNSSSPEDSAKAASEAAIAAKKAADASVASRAKLSAEGLLSGDGTMMTSILSSCFSDPKYGIRKMNTNGGGASELNGSEHSTTQITSTYAYVYLDGDVFIRLNLTAPYWGVSTVLQTVPPPHAHVDGQGDVVDWAIFILLMGVTVFGFIVVIHQLGIVIDKRLQFRHIFHPLADDDSVEIEQLEKGGGIPHSIGIDAIPVSLGGQLSHFQDNQRDGPPTSYKDRLSNSSIDDDDENNRLLGLDIELANRENIVTTVNSPKVTTPTMSDLPISLRLKEEAPDLVERPTLKSMSKVAIPHSSPRNNKERPQPNVEMTNAPVFPDMS